MLAVAIANFGSVGTLGFVFVGFDSSLRRVSGLWHRVI